MVERKIVYKSTETGEYFDVLREAMEVDDEALQKRLEKTKHVFTDMYKKYEMKAEVVKRAEDELQSRKEYIQKAEKEIADTKKYLNTILTPALATLLRTLQEYGVDIDEFLETIKLSESEED